MVNNKNNSWFRSRRYLHFDAPISYRKAKFIVSNPKLVAQHSFFPFINYHVNSFKICKDENDSLQKKNKFRPIAYASHLDSHIYAYYGMMLDKFYENKLVEHGLSENVLAFRSLGKSNIEFANTAFEEIRRRETCSVVALDITGFFDHLDHKTLKKSLSEIINLDELPKDYFNIFKSLTKYSSVSKEELYKLLNISKSNPKKGRYRVCGIKEFREKVRKSGLIKVNKKSKGIPQGSPISALLSNIYMLKFDLKAKQILEEQGGMYYRYCDDMLFITPKEFRDDIEDFAQKQIKHLKLSINTDKTEKRDFRIQNGVQKSNKPLQYLGFTFDGERKLIRSAALARFSNRMKRGVKLAKETQRKRNKIKKSKGLKKTPLYKKKLYQRYSYNGKRNFISYGHRAANIMNSDSIRKQLKPLWKRLQREIDK